MLVSAISPSFHKAYSTNNNTICNKHDKIGDTAFNSLTPYYNKKNESDDKTSQEFMDINEWKRFCQSKIVNQKLDVVV